jgi:hypothetical protein
MAAVEVVEGVISDSDRMQVVVIHTVSFHQRCGCVE